MAASDNAGSLSWFPNSKTPMLPVLPLIESPAYSSDEIPELQAEIRRLARRRGAIILSHNYQRPEIQDVADFVGDSLGLTREAARADTEIIVFCGVHFMAETAAILSPGKRVLLPDLRAQCSLAAMITVDDVRRWRSQFPGYVTIGYVNTTAAVKAELDFCCTSGNLLEVIDLVPPDQGILFLPDFFLGAHARRMRPDRRIEVWLGECHVHKNIRASTVSAARAAHPEAEVMVHPECGCAGQLLYEMGSGDLSSVEVHIASTEGMIRLAAQLEAPSFILATETGIIHRMRQVAPGKEFIEADPEAVCGFMKTITLDRVRDALALDQFVVSVEEGTAVRARRALERMLEPASATRKDGTRLPPP